MESQLVDEHGVFVFRADVDVVEIEQARAQALAAVDERPRFARVARTIEAAFNGRRFDHRVEHARIAARDIEIDLADQFRRQP